MTGAEKQEPPGDWSRRAEPYRRMTSAWPLFGSLAQRLVEFLPRDFNGHALDLAGGAGLLTARLLERFPAARVTLVDTAPGMLRLAREDLGSQPNGGVQGSAEALAFRDGCLDAVLMSAAAHLVALPALLREVARCLTPGGTFAFNLWWHALEETAGLDSEPLWQGPVEEVLRERGDPPEVWPARPVRRTISLAELEDLVASSGLTLLERHLDRDNLATAFFVDWMAVLPTFLPNHTPEARAAILLRARELADEEIEVSTTRFLLRA